MKNLFKIFAISAIAVIAAACSKNSEQDRNVIRLTAQSGLATKVAYSGVKDSNRERIDWESGDMIVIWCPECQVPASHEAYYVLSDFSNSGYISKAKASLYNTDGTAKPLIWNENGADHHIYSVYPCPLQNSSVIFRLFMNTTPATAMYGATVPASQAPVGISSVTGGKVAQPDGKNLIMVADGIFPYQTDVTLNFNPVVTAVEFTVMNGYADQTDMVLSSIKLSAETAAISGKFTAYYGASTATFTETGKVIEIPFTTPVRVAYGETLTFTVFMLGVESATNTTISDMNIEFVTNSTTSIKAKLATSAGVMSFPRGKKSYVTGLIVPAACVWTFSAVPTTVAAWDLEEMDLDLGRSVVIDENGIPVEG